MISVEDVYIAFIRAKGKFNDRPFRIPKKWDSIWSKLGAKNVEMIELLMKAMSTRWNKIDIDTYMDNGFKLFGSKFTYVKFFDRRILLSYIEEDKIKKRISENIKLDMKNSLYFIENYMKSIDNYNTKFSIYIQYGQKYIDGILAPFYHYNRNKIDKYTLIWLISQKYVSYDDINKNFYPYIFEDYWANVSTAIKIKKEIDNEMQY